MSGGAGQERGGDEGGMREEGGVWSHAAARLTVLLSDGQSWFVIGAQLHSLETERLSTGLITNRGCQRGDTACVGTQFSF